MNEPQVNRPAPMSHTQTHPQKEIFMAAQNDQKALQISPSERENNPRQTALSPRRGSSYLGLGITPQEFFSSNPFSLMRRMSEEMDRVFQEFGLDRDGDNKAGWSPAIEVAEKDGKLNIRAELPGLSSDDVKIEAANDALTIQGERKVEHEENQGGVRRSERQYGFFYRTIPLPERADLEHANAKFQNGMLEISIPVPEQKESRRSIPIEGQSKPQEQNQQRAA
jgi:HSP20 family protein